MLWVSLKFETLLVCSKIGIVVVLSSLHSFHHCPAAASCHRHRLHCRLRLPIQLTPVAQCRCRTRSPSASGPLPQQQPPHSSRVALHPAPVLQRVWMPCEGFTVSECEGDSAGPDRLLIQCRVWETSCLKVVQPATCRFLVASCSRARLMATARRRPAKGFFLSLVLSYPPHSNSCWQSRTNCCLQVLCAISSCSLVHLEESASRCAPPPSWSLPPRRSCCRWRVPSHIANLCRLLLRLLSTPHL